MSKDTKISWCTSTFNPWKICTPVGIGCENCYAAALSKRWGWGEYKQGVPRQRTSASNWAQPLKWNKEAARTGKRHLVFCASLADVFDNEVPSAWRAELFALIRETPALTWQLVTKRIGNVPRMLPPDWDAGYPNVWLVSTIVNQDEADRDLPKLLAVPATIHGVSYEPALGPVEWGPLLDLGPRAWIIIGGESTQGAPARQFDLAWARSTLAQGNRAKVPVFMKQVGARPNPTLKLTDRAGAEPKDWPEDLRNREFPKHHVI